MFFLRAREFALGQSTVISAGQVCVFSLSCGSFNSFYLNLVGVKARWRQSLLGADGSRQKAQGLLSDREPLSSAYLNFSLCLITNHSPDSTQAKRRKAGPPQPSSLLIPAPLSFSSLPLSPAMRLGAARWPLKRQTCNLIINNLLNFSKGKQS